MTVTENIDSNLVEHRQKLKKRVKDIFNMKMVKKRVPMFVWLPNYSVIFLIQDTIAGLTVALTAIPQGIAYAVIAGLPPEYGLYASLTAGFVYAIFGSCKHTAIGPTAVQAMLVSKYVAGYSIDFVIIATFLAGIVELVMGICNLGFIVDFISTPVINGFTTAAALQIAAQQLTPFFGLKGSSGYKFIDAAKNFVSNIKTAQLSDSLLGAVTIIFLMLLKKFGEGCSRTDGLAKQIRWFLSLSRNAIVVLIGIIVAFTMKIYNDSEPLNLIGEIGSGLPRVQLPPFQTVIGNETYYFLDILQALGPSAIILPLYAVLATVAVAKTFTESGRVDATQEIIALGMCNFVGSFFSSMPITGAFTRSTLNVASGVQTPFGGIITVLIISVALTLLTSTFYYIPKTSLSGLIIFAMIYMVNYKIIPRLLRNSKREFGLFIITILVSLFFGIEFGIIAGMIVEAAMLLLTAARPKVDVNVVKSGIMEFLIIPLHENVAYCSAEYVRRKIIKICHKSDRESVLVLDGLNVRKIDITVAINLVSIVEDMRKMSRLIVFVNFSENLKKIFLDCHPEIESNFLTVSNFIELSTLIRKDVE